MQDLNDKATGNSLPAAEWNQQPSEIQNIIEAAGITLSGADLNQLGKALSFYIANGDFFTDSGAADAYVLTVQAPKQASPAYGPGEKIVFFPTNDNAGVSTVNRDGVGVVDLKDENGNDLGPVLKTGSLAEFRFNFSAGHFRLFPTLSATIQANLKSGRRNLIVNGDFLVNQRGASLTPSFSQYTIDQWIAAIALDGGSLDGGSVSVDAIDFTLGQNDVPNNPEKFLQFDGHITSGGGNEFIAMQNKIERVENLSGLVAAFSFWVRGSIAGTAALQTSQNFGTGGSPSTEVDIFAQDIDVTTSWVKQVIIVTVPSVSGKLLGTNNDDAIKFTFYNQVGTTRAATIGVSAIDFIGDLQIADVQVEQGSFSTDFDRLSRADALEAAKYYFQRFDFGEFDTLGQFTWNGGASNIMESSYYLPVPMRSAPVSSIITSTGSMQNTGNGTISIALSLLAVSAASIPTNNQLNLRVAPNTDEGTGDSASMEVAGSGVFTFDLSAEI